MGDRISISFKKGDEESVALFSHWGGIAFYYSAVGYAVNLVRSEKNDAYVSDPINRLEPHTVMVDFIRHITKGMKKVRSDVYLGKDSSDGDNSDNGHRVIDLDTVEKEAILRKL